MADPRDEAFNVLVDALNDPKQAKRHAQIRQVLGKFGRATDTAFVDETGEDIGGMSRLELDSEGHTRDVPARKFHEEGKYIQALRPTPAEIEADPNRPDDLQDLVKGGRLSNQLATQMAPKPPPAPPPVQPGYFRSSSMGDQPDTNAFMPRIARGLDRLTGGRDPIEGPKFESMGREYADDNSLLSMGARTVNKLRKPVEKASMTANRYVDAATGGLYSRALAGYSSALGTQIGPSMEDFERFRTENPTVDALTTFAANVNPKGVAGGIARGVNKVADPLIRAVKSRMVTAPGKASAALLGAAVPAAAGNAGTSALEGAIEQAPLGEIAERAKQGGAHGAVFGTAIKGLLKGAGAASQAVRNRKSSGGEDIRVLEAAGLEPSPIPGRPVVLQSQSLMSQLPGRAPPPLVDRATPATRASAARIAADELVADQTAMSKANNQRFGVLQRERYSKEGGNKAPFRHIVHEIDRRLKEEDLADSTKTALEAVRKKFSPYLPKKVQPAPPPAPAAPAAAAPAAPAAPPLPPNIQMLQQLAGEAKDPAVRAGLERRINAEMAQMPTMMAPPPAAPAAPAAPAPPPLMPAAAKPPRPFTARSLDKIRRYTDTKVKKGEVSKGDVHFMQVADLMRDTLAKKGVGPGIAKLNKDYSRTKKSFGKRQALLGMKKNQRGEGEDVAQAVARRIAERGEETKTAGVRIGAEGHDLDRVLAMGRPRTLKGTQLPPAPDYKGLVDAPRVQLAQENNQAVTSKVFSGAGPAQTTGAGLLARYAGYVPNRLIYPLGRRLGTKKVGSGFAADELIRALRQRGEKKEGAEQ